MSSLFPAYSKTHDGDVDKRTSDQDTAKSKADWLINQSFVCSDNDKLQHLNYDYLSCKHNKEDIRNSPHEKSLKRPYVTEGDLESCHIHGAEDVTSPKKTNTEHSPTSSESDESRKLHHLKKKKKKKKHKKHKHNHGKDGHNIRAPAEESASTEWITKQEGKIFVEDFEKLLPEYYHYIDKSSDKANYTYQSIYKGHLPHYRCQTNMSLGLSRTDIQGKYQNRKKKEDHKRYFLSKNITTKEDVDDDMPFTEPVLVSEGCSVLVRKEPILDDYMTLCEDSGQPAKSSKDINTKSASSKSDEVQHPQNIAFKKQEMYNRKLSENPNNVSLWLEFINFQDQCSPTADVVTLYETERGMKRHRNHRALTLQMKEAIFERALKENPYSADLKMAQLECFRNFWDSETLQTQWKELVMRNRSNTKVWEKYLEYAESKAASFTASGLIKAYKKCLLSLKSSVTDFVIDIFVRMCHRLKQSGHVEKATALFQAQLEYNLFAPSPDMVLSASDLIEFFQAFWESTAPRLGEDNACGWKHWIENQGNVKPFVPFVLQDEDESLEQEIVKKHSDKHDIWFAMETLRTSRHWLAWKPDGSTEDDECEDLERLVVSDDVTFALFSVSKPLQKMKLLLQFLDFLGVPVEKHHCTVCRIGISDLDAAVKLENISDIFRHHCHASCALNLPEERQITFMNRHKFIENLFIQMFSLFRSSETIWNSLMMMYIDFLEQKVLAGKDQWSEKQLKAKGKEMRSVMKKLLFEEPFRHSKLAWLRYAVMEWCIGRQDDARKALYHVLMSLVHGNTDDSKPPTMYHPHSVELMVYRTYAEMEMGLIHGGCLLKGQKGDRANRESGRQKALQVLVSMCIGDFTIPSEDFSITTIQLVKCKKHYTNIQDELLHNITEADMPSDEDCYTVLTLGSSLEHWVVCYAIFIYITTGLAAAVEVFNEVYTSLGCTLQKKEGKGNEQYDMILDIMQRVTESHLFLLNFHIRQECAPLRTIRVPLSEAMQRYPANVNILWSYIMLELRGAFTVNLRRHLTKLCCTSKSSLTWTLSIIAQLQHLEKLKMVAMETKTSSVPEAQLVLPEVGYINTVRSWFQWALSTDVCRHYLLLWRTYLRFEIKHAKPETAKKVFYEAIQHCPWAKCLYMDYIEAFPASTQEVVDLMVERELRVHVPLEEIEILMEEA